MDIELFDRQIIITEEFEFGDKSDYDYLIFEDSDLDISDVSDDKTVLD
jgi:hypothetical protein